MKNSFRMVGQIAMSLGGGALAAGLCLMICLFSGLARLLSQGMFKVSVFLGLTKNPAVSGIYLHIFLAFVVGVITAIKLFKRTSGQVAIENHCIHCQYDLTSNQSGICPECGSPIVATSPAGPAARAHCARRSLGEEEAM